MDNLVELWETPLDRDNYMIAGWDQWADAGQISSELPRYLIELTGARKIGQLKADGFYFFQIPGTHHLLRPEVKLNAGYRESMSTRKNDVYYAELEDRGLVIFTGEEPHQNEQRYADAFFDLAEALNVKRTVGVGGVFGAVPFDKDREVSCVYSLPKLKVELDNYAVRFSNYEGGTTIGTYLAHWAEYREAEFITMYSFAPAYEFSQLGVSVQAMRMDEDWKSWLDLMRRIDYMMGLGLDLRDLEDRSRDLLEAWSGKLDALEEEHPELHIRAYLEAMTKDFQERTFIPLDDAWDELGDLFDGMSVEEEDLPDDDDDEDGDSDDSDDSELDEL